VVHITQTKLSSIYLVKNLLKLMLKNLRTKRDLLLLSFRFVSESFLLSVNLILLALAVPKISYFLKVFGMVFVFSLGVKILL